MTLKTTRGTYPKQEVFAERKLSNESFEFVKSRFIFLQDHYGLRNGKIHLFLGTTGSGKSTIIRSIIEEALINNKVTLVYSSEETVEDYETNFAYQEKSLSKFNLKNLIIFHEIEMLKRTSNKIDIEQFINQLDLAIVENNTKLFVFDNITTSEFYDQNEDANMVSSKLMALCIKHNIPFVVVAHTGSQIRDGSYFDSSCIRGNRSITNKAQYLYCYYRLRESFQGLDKTYNFIVTEKSRLHSQASKGSYKLFFDHESRLISSDIRVPYEDLNRYLRKK